MTTLETSFDYVIARSLGSRWMLAVNGTELGRFERFREALELATSLANLDRLAGLRASIQVQHG